MSRRPKPDKQPSSVPSSSSSKSGSTSSTSSDSKDDSKTGMREMLREINEVLSKALGGINISEFSYQGFDEIATLNAIKEKIGGDGARHLAVLLAYYVKNSPKATADKLEKISKSASSKVKEALKHYNIDPSARVKKSTDLSISRIVAVLPNVVLGMRVAERPCAGVTVNIGENILEDPLFCSPEGAYMIPRDQPNVFEVWQEWARAFHNKINQKTSAKYNEDIAFAKFQSNIVSDEMRAKLYAGLLDRSGFSNEDLEKAGKE